MFQHRSASRASAASASSAAPVSSVSSVSSAAPVSSAAAAPSTFSTAAAPSSFSTAAVLTATALSVGVAAACGPAPARPAPAGEWRAEDWEIFEAKVRQAGSEGLAELPPGETAGRLALSFVGTAYTPGTLEAEGPEGLVINFRELDCVTFVENVLAMTRFVRADGVELLEDPPAARARYERYLTDLRYRGGVLDGYASRLHYFSEWLTDNESMGLLEIVTPELDPDMDDEPVDFMSTHPDAYRQLADPAVLGEIEAMERSLGGRARPFVPQERIAGAAHRVATGDVIAATSTVAGLDVAHTGLAVWVDRRLHLVHAPLVGKAVEVSEAPLAERIRAIPGQDGVMVARPVYRP